MAALVQTIPQQSDLQSRPSSSSSSFPSSQSLHPAGSMSWHSFQTNTGSGGYRQPVAPYAFPSPNLSPSSQSRQSRPHHLKVENRTTSAPSVPQGAPAMHTGLHPRYNYPISSPSSSSNSSFHSYRSKDDTAIPLRQPRSDHTRPLSTANLPSPASLVNLSSKPFPDRYRRGVRRDGPSPTVDDQSSSAGLRNPLSSMPQNRAHTRVSSADGTRQERPQPDLAKRYRRRSVGNIDTTAPIHLPLNLPSSSWSTGSHDYFDSNPRPPSSHSRKDSGSNHSAHSSTSSVRCFLLE